MTSLEEIRQLEEQLDAKKRALAAELYAARQRANLSLSQVARTVRVSAPTVNDAERGRAWNPRTIAKLVRFFSRKDGNADGQSTITL